MKIDKEGIIRFEEGEQTCQSCKAKSDIVQFERSKIQMGVPTVQMIFLCKKCAIENGVPKEVIEKGEIKDEI